MANKLNVDMNQTEKNAISEEDKMRKLDNLLLFPHLFTFNEITIFSLLFFFTTKICIKCCAKLNSIHINCIFMPLNCRLNTLSIKIDLGENKTEIFMNI